MVVHVTRPRLAWIESGSRLEYAWVAFAVLNLAAMLAIIEIRYGQGWETVPFHFIYVSFTILYGFRAWKGRATLLGILFVTITTGVVTAFGIHRNWEEPPEITEVPLMSLMFVAMVYHVHRRQQAQAVAEALAAERERDLERKSAFLSDASHELLTPITIGRGHLELLHRNPNPEPGELAETYEIVLGELGRMERVINRLLLLESAGGAAARGSRERVDAAALLTRTFQRWRSTADRDWRLGELPPGTISIDADQLTLALDALVENAVQHTDDGGHDRDRRGRGERCAADPRRGQRRRDPRGRAPDGCSTASTAWTEPAAAAKAASAWASRSSRPSPRHMAAACPSTAGPARGACSRCVCRACAQQGTSRYPPPRTVSITASASSLRRSRATQTSTTFDRGSNW